jgi:hypothetical protein
MSSSALAKSQIYYLLRRGWYQQTMTFCDSLLSKKGNEPVSFFWHSFALGMIGNITDCIRELESVSSKNLHFPVSAALLYFCKRLTPTDHEMISSLESELSVAEDVAKEVDLALAARFYLYTGNYSEGRRVAKKITELNRGSPTTVYDVEAYLIEQWCHIEEMTLDWNPSSSDQRRILSAIVNTFRNNKSADFNDSDALMLWTKANFLLGNLNECYAILNQASPFLALFSILYLFLFIVCCRLFHRIKGFFLVYKTKHFF